MRATCPHICHVRYLRWVWPFCLARSTRWEVRWHLPSGRGHLSGFVTTRQPLVRAGRWTISPHSLILKSMCGIVGLLIRNPSQRSHLGEWSAPILDCMGDRGADSSGMALFGTPLSELRRRASLFAEKPAFDWSEFRRQLAAELDPS